MYIKYFYDHSRYYIGYALKIALFLIAIIGHKKIGNVIAGF